VLNSQFLFILGDNQNKANIFDLNSNFQFRIFCKKECYFASSLVCPLPIVTARQPYLLVKELAIGPEQKVALIIFFIFCFLNIGIA
jgi:hypothetical protein